MLFHFFPPVTELFNSEAEHSLADHARKYGSRHLDRKFYRRSTPPTGFKFCHVHPSTRHVHQAAWALFSLWFYIWRKDCTFYFFVDCKTAPSFARSPKSGVFERVLTRGRKMRERSEEGVARSGEKGNGERGGRKGLSPLYSLSPHFLFPLAAWLLPRPFSQFKTARQNSLKNPAFRTSGEGRGCFAV